jgi:Sulfotransferase domain
VASAIPHPPNRQSPTLFRQTTPTSENGGVRRGHSLLSDIFHRRKVERVDFIVAGVQKAGTTALHDFLAQHPHVALLRDQALHFFDKEEHFKSAPDYRILHGNFKPGRRWRVAGEVTADYLYYPRALNRIAQYNPEMKLVISLRNPTERAFSQWNMRRDKGQEQLDFVDALKRDQEIGVWQRPRGNAYIARSLYSPQLEAVFDLFPREQVLVLKYEEIRRDPAPVVDRLFDFLGVKRLGRFKNKKRNVGSYSRKLSAEERDFAAGLFDEDINRTEKLLGWDCSDWRYQPKASAVR